MVSKVRMIIIGSPINIKSVYSHEGLRGYLYVEAYKIDDVKNACRGMRDLMWYKPTMVATKEMVEVFAVKAQIREIAVGSWARTKRGTYAKDLCKIMEHENNKLRVMLVPRMQLYEDDYDDDDDDEGAFPDNP